MSPVACFTAALRQCCTNAACAPFFLLALVFYSFYYCWPYAAQLPEHITAAIVDGDDTPLSRRLIRSLAASPRLDVRQVVADPAAAVAAMKEQKVTTIIGIPENFERDALAGLPTAMTLVTNGTFIVKARSSMSGASGPLQEVAGEAIAAQLAANGVPMTGIRRMTMRAPAYVVQNMYNTIGGYLNFVVPIVFMVIFQTLMICGAGMMFNDWFERTPRPEPLRLAMASPVCLFAVQMPVFAICFFWSLATEGVIFYLHGINSFQSVPSTILAGMFYSLAVSSIGVFAGILLGPTRFVIQAVIPSSIPAVFISGNLWPAQNIPFPMRALSWLFPSTPGSWGMLRASQAGACVGEVFPYLMHMLALAALYFLLAVMLAARVRNSPKTGSAFRLAPKMDDRDEKRKSALTG